MGTHSTGPGPGTLPGVAGGPCVRLENVTVRRGHRPVLTNIDWLVEPGRHWVVLGPNGSGKTSLLHVIYGNLWPYKGEGTVTVLGQRLGACDIQQVRRAMGWVSSALHQRFPAGFTGLDIVLTGKFATTGLWRPFARAVTDQDREQALDLLARFQCGHLARQPYGAMSQGEQQRIQLARALMARPRLLMLDEPCAGLDFVAREQFLAMVEEVLTRPDGPTVIYVTHHGEEILPAFANLLLLSQGRVAAQGPTEQVLTGEALGRAYGVPMEVHRHGGRPVITLARGGLDRDRDREHARQHARDRARQQGKDDGP